MKSIIAAVLFVPIIAQAEALAYLENKGGGRIVFTDEVCIAPNGKRYDNLAKMYGYDKGGQSLDGCYGIEDNMIVGVWEDGAKYRYNPESLVIIKKPGKRL